MLQSTFSRWFRGRTSQLPSIPGGLRVYAVGDIHGRLDLLDALLLEIDADDALRPPAQTHLIFLGDLIDRGPQSAGVVDRVMQLSRSHPRVGLLMGNHEEVFLRALEGDARATKLLARIGGRATMMSYGIAQRDYELLDYADLTALLKARVPEDHVDFLRSFEDHIAIGDYTFVHAGIRPGVPLEAQRASDLRWIRDEFLEHRGSHGTMIVHGHSITEDVDRQVNRIGIDTGAFATGRLTAIGLEGEESWFLSTGERDP